jgi:hypothetical protein
MKCIINCEIFFCLLETGERMKVFENQEQKKYKISKQFFNSAVGIHPDNFSPSNHTTSNKCEMLNNLNLKVGGSSGRVVNLCC